jgi:hypothetical protein
MNWNRLLVKAGVLLLCGGLFAGCSTPSTPMLSGVRIDPGEYPILRQAQPRADLIWRRLAGPDFEIFYGNPIGKTTTGFGFYIGGFPNFHPGTNAVVVPGKLGAFPLDWCDSIEGKAPRFHREGVFPYRVVTSVVNNQPFKTNQRIHLWIYGESAEEVLGWTEFLDGLEVFNQQPQR